MPVSCFCVMTTRSKVLKSTEISAAGCGLSQYTISGFMSKNNTPSATWWQWHLGTLTSKLHSKRLMRTMKAPVMLSLGGGSMGSHAFSGRAPIRKPWRNDMKRGDIKMIDRWDKPHSKGQQLGAKQTMAAVYMSFINRCTEAIDWVLWYTLNVFICAWRQSGERGWQSNKEESKGGKEEETQLRRKMKKECRNADKKGWKETKIE